MYGSISLRKARLLYKRCRRDLSIQPQNYIAWVKQCQEYSGWHYIFGATRSEHDENVVYNVTCLQRLAMKGLRLCLGECNFLSSTLIFFGNVFLEWTYSSWPQESSRPNNAQSPTFPRYAWRTTVVTRAYIPCFAALTAVLPELTKKDVLYACTQKHWNSFEKLKNTLVTAPCMSYFDKRKYVCHCVCISGINFGNSVATTKTPWCKKSTSSCICKSNTERRREKMLVIVWTVEHFHQFLFGIEFTLITNRKHLEGIYGQHTAKTRYDSNGELRILHRHPYTFKIVCKLGRNNPADCLTRHPTHDIKHKTQEKMTEQYVNFVTKNSVQKVLPLKEIVDATNSNVTLTRLPDAIKTNK